MTKERIIWIDWAKTIGIMIVVFCHIPQYNTMVKQFLCTMEMPLFFILSGYLHNSNRSLQTNVHKYWKSLVIPYILFQFIFYPYFYIRKTFDGEDVNGIYNGFIKPILGCLFGTPIDGTTWFIYALIIMKLLMDLASSKKSILLIYILISVFTTYLISNDHIYNISFAIDSFFMYFPFFILGWEIKHNDMFRKIKNVNRLAFCMISFFILLLCLLIILLNPSFPYIIQIFNIYISGTLGSAVVIALCICIHKSNKFIYVISNGTIILLGLHWMFIGTFNYVLEKSIHINNILYNTAEAALIVLFITLANYFIILFCNKHFKIILGGRSM